MQPPFSDGAITRGPFYLKRVDTRTVVVQTREKILLGYILNLKLQGTDVLNILDIKLYQFYEKTVNIIALSLIKIQTNDENAGR